LPNSSEETSLLPDGFFTALDPQVRLLTLPNFGVNREYTRSLIAAFFFHAYQQVN
jgi:hypothetical protein